MKLKKLLTGLLAASLVTISVTGTAATDTATLNISATAVTGCTFDTNSYNINFGNYDGSSIASTSVNIGFTCATAGVGYTIEANNGNNFDAGNGDRRVTDGAGHYLAYDLAKDSGFTQPLGTIADGTEISGTSGSAGVSNSITIYAGMPDSQPIAAAGSYTDTVTLTLTF